MVRVKRPTDENMQAAATLCARDRSTVYETLMNAISEHRLKPGTKLTEEKLASIFKVSRTVVREALQQMAFERVVEILPNRGAFIASPTIAEAKEFFQARRYVEVPILENICQRVTAQEIKLLRQHVREEEHARHSGDRRKIVRLSGEFHVLLASLSGNRFLERAVRGLQLLTCLTILLYDTPTDVTCQHNEHKLLVDAIESRDVVRAQKLMLDHLREIENSLHLEESEEEEEDLEEILLGTGN
ncbi:GntR family transcriptional regulator [Raoultella planticola]|nr:MULTISPECIES: GntR family transcriptional regulator [Klebsiella]TDV01137.1 DNA-binding GntR family transcriptional regulator [Raoultella planticola]TDX31801.1 GntR family transcriptional regulator [Raoultella planticola]HBM3023201.1 GntR family transcriptional regulator [Klebsiella michiganensis]HCC7083519.1 GntR family transcriptional regulator [Klebsiella michiganensis]